MSQASDDPSGEGAPSSETVTSGIRVKVQCAFLPEHSVQDGAEAERRWAFSYTVTITNEGRELATLLARHWIITDGSGRTEQVRGPGVVGFQPALAGGQSFTYTSGCVLKTSGGTMHGTYLMEREDGSRFDANIAPFALVTPDFVN